MAPHWSSKIIGRCSICYEGILSEEAFKVTKNGAILCEQCAEAETNIVLYTPKVYKNWICVNCRHKWPTVIVPECRAVFCCPTCGTQYHI